MRHPESYFLPPSANDVDLAGWKDLAPEGVTVLALTQFADVIFRHRDGSIHLLEPAACSSSRIADSEAEFWRRIREDEEGWQLRPLVDRLRAAGKLLPAEHCYAFTRLPVLGGDYEVDNVWVCPLREWVAYTADIYRQIEELPDGATVRLKPLR